MTVPRGVASLGEFWPHYLREHARAETRTLHLAGTAVATVALFALFVSGNPWFLPGALVAGYGPAWFGHFFYEHNHPTAFRHPLWSLVAAYRMAWAWVLGQLDSELDKAGIAER